MNIRNQNQTTIAVRSSHQIVPSCQSWKIPMARQARRRRSSAAWLFQINKRGKYLVDPNFFAKVRVQEVHVANWSEGYGVRAACCILITPSDPFRLLGGMHSENLAHILLITTRIIDRSRF